MGNCLSGYINEGFKEPASIKNMSILQTTELKKYYGSGPNTTKALDGDTVDRKFMDEVVRLLSLGDKLDNMPNNLSGGQQQRVAIVYVFLAAAIPAIVLRCFNRGTVVGRLRATE